MSTPPICHMSGKAVAAELVTIVDDVERAACYACGRSVLVRDGRYAEHRARRRIRTRR